MATMQRLSPEIVTREEFQDILGQYERVIETVSASKTTKTGQKTLAELDAYRYREAPSLFSLQDPKRAMVLSDVKTLVEWKLKHGKFRPTLMKLVSSNEENFVSDTIKAALEAYKKKGNPLGAVEILTKLKGIGPATASLLLAVHDPDNVIFFADEAFYWLCSGGRKESIKYNAKEYKELNERTQKFAKRLNTKAVDVERVAYVLMSGAGTTAPPSEKTKSSVTKQVAQSKPANSSKPKQSSVVDNPGKKTSQAAKRKQKDAGDDAPIPRRSKRGKTA